MKPTGGNEYFATINVETEEIDMGSIGSYTFAQYEDYSIDPSENTIKNLMVVMTIYHALQPNTTKNFNDNGGEEYQPPAEGIFWGKDKIYEKGVNELQCGEGSVGVVKCWDYNILWIRVVNNKCGEPDCIPPN